MAEVYYILPNKVTQVSAAKLGQCPRYDLGELSLCGDARSSEKPRTNEGN